MQLPVDPSADMYTKMDNSVDEYVSSVGADVVHYVCYRYDLRDHSAYVCTGF